MDNRLSLTIFKGSEEIGVENFDREIIKIGRLASAHLKLDDPRVSRIHAVIEVARSGQDISIIDMGSAEGTFVNGEKVTKIKLKEGDEIRLGETRLVLGFQKPDAPAVAAPAPTSEPAPVAPAPAGPVEAPPPPVEATAPIVHASTELVGQQAGSLETLSELPLPQDGEAVFETFEDNSPTEMLPPAPAQFADAPVVPASMLSPGVAGNALVAPLPDAPSPEWYDPYGELNQVAVENEQPVNNTNRCLEIAITWDEQLLDVRHYNEPKKVTMGETKKCDIFVVSEGLPDNEFPIVRFMDGEYVLTYFDGLNGGVEVSEMTTSLGDLGGQADENFAHSYQYNLPLNSVTKIEYGGMEMQLRFVPPTGGVVTSPFQDINYNWLNVFLISLFLHVGFFATTALYPYDTKSLEEDLFSSPNRFAQFILNPPEKEKNSLLSKLMKGKTGESSAKHAGSEGKAGKQDAKDTGKRMASKSDKPTNEMVVQSKLNQLFGKEGGGGGVSSVFGGGLGGELVGALGGVTGAQIGDSYGFGGLGTRGHGPGGGGSSTTTFGVGSIGTRGRGGGASGYGSGAGGLGGKSDRAVKISQGTPVIMGSLDKEIIRRVIRENISQIRYCYERELARSPGLYGKIQVKFIIAATGKVSNSQVAETTMKNAAVESCIVNKVRGWRFPKPKGGGIVIVTYPFIFKQSG